MNYEKGRLQLGGQVIGLVNLKEKAKGLFIYISYSSNKPGFINKNGSDVRCEKLTERRLRKKR